MIKFNPAKSISLSVTVLPAPEKMAAVYAQDDGTVNRSPIHFISFEVTEYTHENGRVTRTTYGTPVVFDGYGYSDTHVSNCIGYEVDGEEKDWSEEIKNYLA